jgi:hypothetical protein
MFCSGSLFVQIQCLHVVCNLVRAAALGNRVDLTHLEMLLRCGAKKREFCRNHVPEKVETVL